MEKEWDKILVRVQLDLNNSVCETVGVTPTQVLLGFNAAVDTQFNFGDLVLVKISSIVTTGQGRRLRDRYKGPYIT